MTVCFPWKGESIHQHHHHHHHRLEGAVYIPPRGGGVQRLPSRLRFMLTPRSRKRDP